VTSLSVAPPAGALLNAVWFVRTEVPQGVPCILDELHLSEIGGQRVSGGGNRLNGGMAGFFGCAPSVLGGLPKHLPFTAHRLHGLAMSLAECPGFVGENSKQFRLLAAGFGDDAALFGGSAVATRLLTKTLRSHTTAFGPDAHRFCCVSIVGHWCAS
jgi:hypothetical protein